MTGRCSTSSSRACPGSSTAATTRPGWPWWAPPARRGCGGPGRPTGPGPSTTWSSGPKELRGAPAPASAIPGGPPTVGRPRATPIPMSTVRAGWPSSTTGSSRTTSSWPTSCGPPATTSSRRPTPRSWPISSKRSLAADPDAGLVGAVRASLGRIRGAFSVAVVHSDEPELIVASRRVSPLLMGVTESAAFLASDVPAILGLTREFFVLEDDQIAELRPGSLRVTTLEGTEVEPDRLTVDWDLDSARKDGFDDYMSKEIREQPRAVADTMLDRVLPDGTLVLDEVHITNEEFRAFNKVFIVACGSSYHAGLMAKYAIEHWARLPVEIDIASEFRYRDPVLDATTLVIGVSQSGETADTFEAIVEARRLGAKVLVISNVVDSSMARKADAVLYTRAGPEIGVAATKTHLAQITALEILALYLGQARGTLPAGDARALFAAMGALPEKVALAIDRAAGVEEVATRYRDSPSFIFLGPPCRVPGGPGGSPQAEGAVLPPGRGLPGRRAQARAHRPGRAGHGGHRGGHPHPHLGEDDEQRGRGQEPGGDCRAGGQRRRRGDGPPGGRRAVGAPRPRTCSHPSSTWCRCSCSPTRWPDSTVTTSTDPATWPRWSPSSEPGGPGRAAVLHAGRGHPGAGRPQRTGRLDRGGGGRRRRRGPVPVGCWPGGPAWPIGSSPGESGPMRMRPPTRCPGCRPGSRPRRRP